MRFQAVVFIALLPVTLSACGQRDARTAAEMNNSMSNETSASDDSNMVAPSNAQSFVNKAAASDRFEIETSKLVASSAASPAVMDYGRMMIAAHTQSTAKLKGIVAKDPAGVIINDELSPAQKAALEDMKSKKGYIFDAAYLAAQIYGHDETLTELENYAATGDNAALKEFANGLIPTVTEHLDKAKSLQGKIGPGAR